MRNSLFIAIAVALCGAAHADTVTFIPLQTPAVQLGKISGNGAYASGGIFATAGFRWTASTGVEELIPELNAAGGINNAGTIAGSVPVNGGSNNGGDDLGAYAAVGGAPVQLTGPLQADSDGYDIADDGTVVGLSFGHAFARTADAFVWTAAAGMSLLPVNHPANYSRANVISADGHVIAGWNDQDSGGRTAVIWQRNAANSAWAPLDVIHEDGSGVGEADGISPNGQFVVGGDFADASGGSRSWRWNGATGAVDSIPGMAFAFGVSNDGKTVVGANGFFDNPPRAAMIWHEGVGTQPLVDYLTAQGVTLPTGWDPGLAGGFSGISGDGSLMGGWSFGPSNGNQSYLIRTTSDRIFGDGFDGTPPLVSKRFSPASVVAQGAPSTLTIGLVNPATAATTLTSDLVDTFPAGLVVAATPAASTNCPGGTVVAAAGSGSVTLQTGANIPAGGFCSIVVSVTSTAGGDYANTIPVGALVTSLGSNAVAATASLHVLPPGNNGIVSRYGNHVMADNSTGTSLNMVTGAIDDTGPFSSPWDFNFSDNSGFQLAAIAAPDSAFVVDGTGNAIVMHVGDVIGSTSTWSSYPQPAPAWLAGTDGYLGVRFKCDGREVYPVATKFCYGYLHFTTTAAAGYPATLVDYSFDGDGNPSRIRSPTRRTP